MFPSSKVEISFALIFISVASRLSKKRIKKVIKNIFLTNKNYFSLNLITPIIEMVNNIIIGNHTDKINGNFPFSPNKFEK